MRIDLAHQGPHGLADWNPLFAILAAFVAATIALSVAGRTRFSLKPTELLRRTADGLERVTGVAGWAAGMMGMATVGLLVAGQGFYNDVAWHVGLGRDEELFTAPHTGIVVGLLLISAAGITAIASATVTRADVGLRWRSLRVPWSALVMTLLGASAVSGFPLDELWHAQYGIDVTMWSPTHLLMIVGASLSPLASWLGLAEARAWPAPGWTGVLHVMAAFMSLLGLTSVQGEFAFGVPQFQQLYHPVLIAVAAGIVLVAARIVIDRWWSPLLVAGLGLFVGAGDSFADAGHVEPRGSALYVGSALAITAAAAVVGMRRRARFALASGVGIATVGVAAEYLWSQRLYQPWQPTFVDEAVVWSLVAGTAAAMIGVALGGALRGEGITVPRSLVRLAFVAVLVALVVPFPRRVGEVTATIDVTTSDGAATVRATLDPPDAADDARWFQAIAWQGGGFVASDMVETDDGSFRSEAAVPVDGRWKAMLRLHRGAEMMTVPIALPDDPEIGATAIVPVDKTAAFEREETYLLREQHPGDVWFSYAIYGLLGALALVWVGAFARTTDRAPVRESEGTPTLV